MTATDMLELMVVGGGIGVQTTRLQLLEALLRRWDLELHTLCRSGAYPKRYHCSYSPALDSDVVARQLWNVRNFQSPQSASDSK